jgi:hypothetical protein
MKNNLKLINCGRNRQFVWFLYSEYGKWLIEVMAGSKSKSFTTSTETAAMVLIQELRIDYEAGNF